MTRILLIDDDDSFRAMLATTLTKLGHTVCEAPDGNAGILAMRTFTAELVITDLIMPDKEGLETIIEMRRIDPTLRIIAMSGGGRGSAEDYLDFAKILGARAVLQKPFGRDKLEEAIRAVLT